MIKATHFFPLITEGVMFINYNITWRLHLKFQSLQNSTLQLEFVSFRSGPQIEAFYLTLKGPQF